MEGNSTGHKTCWEGQRERVSVFEIKKVAFHTYSIYTIGMKKSTKISTLFPPSLDSALDDLERQHRILLAELTNIGLVLRGSIEPRFNRCGNPTCRCKANPPVFHGPYEKWTRKVAGKTVNATLTPEQATLLKEWNRNMHELDRIVRQLQDIGLRAATLVLET
jgi:hypothetical protein